MHTMPQGKLRPTLAEVKALLAQDRDFVRPIVEGVLQELLEAEMTAALGAEKGERTPARRERRSSWRDFLLGLRERGLSGVEFVVSDDHGGLRQAIIEVLPARRSAPTTKVGAGSQARLAAVLRALPAQRARLRAAQGRR
jgi:transposase-like protein